MKALIFLVFIVAAVSVMILVMRRSQARTDLARRKSIQARRKREKEAVTPHKHVTWPVIVKPVKSQQGPKSESDSERRKEDERVEEPSMTTIEFVPTEHRT